MKLVRYRSATGDEPGLILDGEVFDLSGSFSALNHRIAGHCDLRISHHRSCGTERANPRQTTARGPFHRRSESIASALSATTSEPSPQKAGSDWVWNCSAIGKYPLRRPVAKASANTRRPSGDENAIA